MQLLCFKPFQWYIRRSIVRYSCSMSRKIIDRYNTYDWKPNPSISVDSNFMDLTLLVTRSSTLKHGSMACILVQHIDDIVEPIDCDLSYYLDHVISVSTNMALYKENESDIHAEIAAIGIAAREGYATNSCTAYITMPPCRKCFAALLCAGARRIVSRHDSPLVELAERHNIEMITLHDWDGHRDRTNAIVQEYKHHPTITEDINEPI